MSFIDCEGWARDGRIAEAAEASNRGLCIHQNPQPAPTTAIAPPPASTDTGLPSWGLAIVLGFCVLAAATQGIGKLSGAAYRRRHGLPPARPQYLPPSPPAVPYAHTDTGRNAHQPGHTAYPGHSSGPIHTESQPGYTAPYGGGYAPTQGAYIGITQPSPWLASPSQAAAIAEDVRASDVTTASLWGHLKACTIAEFRDRIGAGSHDPVAMADTRDGIAAARAVVCEFLRHGITEVGKLGWVAFGCDGQGGSKRATATAALIKEFKADYQSIGGKPNV